jgi:hypothetical protein
LNMKTPNMLGIYHRWYQGCPRMSKGGTMELLADN